MTEEVKQEELEPLIVNIELTVEKLNVIIGQLAKSPFEIVAEVILDMRNQAVSQLQEMAKKANAVTESEGA